MLLDFIGTLPEEHGKDTILTMADLLGTDIHIAATHSMYTAAQVAVILFDEWYCENGLMLHLISDWDLLSLPNFGLHSTSLPASNLKCRPHITPKQMVVVNRQTKLSTKPSDTMWTTTQKGG